MADVPENVVTPEDLTRWYLLQQQLAELKRDEALLRGKLFHHYFPNPTEGTNNFPLDDGTGAVLKGMFSYSRDVDEGAVEALKDELKNRNIPLGKLLKYKPSLVKTEYNKLTAEEQQFFDQVLIIKPASPSMKIEIPKKAS